MEAVSVLNNMEEYDVKNKTKQSKTEQKANQKKKGLLNEEIHCFRRNIKKKKKEPTTKK